MTAIYRQQIPLLRVVFFCLVQRFSMFGLLLTSFKILFSFQSTNQLRKKNKTQFLPKNDFLFQKNRFQPTVNKDSNHSIQISFRRSSNIDPSYEQIAIPEDFTLLKFAKQTNKINAIFFVDNFSFDWLPFYYIKFLHLFRIS